MNIFLLKHLSRLDILMHPNLGRLLGAPRQVRGQVRRQILGAPRRALIPGLVLEPDDFHDDDDVGLTQIYTVYYPNGDVHIEDERDSNGLRVSDVSIYKVGGWINEKPDICFEYIKGKLNSLARSNPYNKFPFISRLSYFNDCSNVSCIEMITSPKTKMTVYFNNDSSIRLISHTKGRQGIENFTRSMHHNTNDQPAQIEFYPNGKIQWIAWYLDGKPHRDNNKPADMAFKESGELEYMKYHTNGRLDKVIFFDPTTTSMEINATTDVIKVF